MAATTTVAAGSTDELPPPGAVERVSVGSDGTPGDNDSQAAALTSDGRFVAFASLADNLVPDDTNGSFDVFVRDRRSDTTERASVGPLGEQGDGNSGVLTAFDRPDLSADGRFVVFTSSASNFAGLADTNGVEDVFLRDRLLGTTELISVGLDGKAAEGSEPSISADGRFVSFTSFGDTLVPGDDNFASDVFVRDRSIEKTTRVSVTSDGRQVSEGSFASALTADGGTVAFDSFSDELVAGDRNDAVDVFAHNRANGRTTGISTRTSCDGSTDICGNSFLGSLTAGGRFVGFSSTQRELVPGDDDFVSDAFVVDRRTGGLTLVSQSSGGVKGDDDSIAPLVRAGGRVVVFTSRAGNLVPRDRNQQQDVFRRNLATGVTRRIAADDGAFPFPIAADDITARADQTALVTRADLKGDRPPDVSLFASQVYVLEHSDP